MKHEAIINRARAITRTLGIRRAAGYLRNQQYEFADTLRILCGPMAVWRAVSRGYINEEGKK